MRALVVVVALIFLSILILGCIPRQTDDTAGRYHLRERVSDFFERGDTLAARYHLRTRAVRFFGREVC